jgi:hypothetical protein
MRTTLTLDDDVAALLERVQAKRKTSLKETVNTALRSGLISINAPAERRAPFRTKTLINGPRSLPDIDNIAEVLAVLESEDHK